MEHPEQSDWSEFAFDPSATPIVGKWSREWTAVESPELRCVQEMPIAGYAEEALCLRYLSVQLPPRRSPAVGLEAADVLTSPWPSRTRAEARFWQNASIRHAGVGNERRDWIATTKSRRAR